MITAVTYIPLDYIYWYHTWYRQVPTYRILLTYMYIRPVARNVYEGASPHKIAPSYTFLATGLIYIYVNNIR